MPTHGLGVNLGQLEASVKATDANISQALVDRFAYGQTNHGKGTNANPGFFHGFYRTSGRRWHTAYADLVAALTALRIVVNRDEPHDAVVRA